MTNSNGCDDNKSIQNSMITKTMNSIHSVQPVECVATVHENICTQADVTINPIVTVGEIESYCIGLPVIGVCPGMPSIDCTFTVSQNVCVQIPLTFSANVTAISKGIICGTPIVGPCPSTISCTYTIGYYSNHPDIVQQLIMALGGSIVLGIVNKGLSFIVTTTNAGNVLTLNTPSPPVPSTPPYKEQYQNLYAQLLAAKLNVINGATCDFAINAINSADTFLANSPSGGMMGAPGVQTPLNDFNNGNAPNCPAHCTSK